MKKIYTASCLLVITALSGFTTPTTKQPLVTHYAFVTATEWDKSLDEPGHAGRVALTTGIVEFSCDNSGSMVAHQFITYYKGEEETTTRGLEYGSPLDGWVYDTYDKAVAARRFMIANNNNLEHKRRIEGFSATCE
ncbi:hypothetical protein GO988_00945 [Hymenobacter sp. HMF4947]|uniref:Uncharacterized protein n=1 Tax=Hymenobacter ginkgonis TaxID=2682976 RepID=A0A7K1T911_9BACT|nr:hypothetical protein [Hymenobacter ginkgonis]MVN74885.1 hypothetical protein [Hymenobacter ginkgonis]